jgi:hypothetical protein
MRIRFNMRAIFRWVHIIVAIPVYGYLYSPFDKLPLYAAPARYVFFPIMVLTGLLMWKGHVVRSLFSRRQALASPSGSSQR